MKVKKLLAILLSMTLIISSSTTLAFASNDKKDDAFKEIKLDNKNMYEKVKKDKNFKFIYDNGNGIASFTVDENSKLSKEEVFATLSDYSSNYIWNLPVQGYTSSNYKDGSVQLRFQTSVIFNDSFYDTLSLSGQSGSSWNGTGKASYISQADSFSVSGANVNVSVAFDALPSYGFSSWGDGCSFTYPTIQDNYAYFHYYSGVNFTGFAMTGFSQSNAASYVFGIVSVTTNCQAYQPLIFGL